MLMLRRRLSFISGKNSCGCATRRLNNVNTTISTYATLEGNCLYHKTNTSYITSNNNFTRSNLIDELLALAMPWGPTPTRSPLRPWTHLQKHLRRPHL
jgi:hypothetical protein